MQFTIKLPFSEAQEKCTAQASWGQVLVYWLQKTGLFALITKLYTTLITHTQLFSELPCVQMVPQVVILTLITSEALWKRYFNSDI